MKHLLNNMTEEEKNAIREQHSGGMKVSIDNFSNLVESKLGDVKPLVNEQVQILKSLKNILTPIIKKVSSKGNVVKNVVTKSDDVIKNSGKPHQIKLSPNPDWIRGWFSSDANGMIRKLMEKVRKLDKIPFNPKNVKVISMDVLDSVENGVFRQRPVIEIKVKETGDIFLLYSSTGTGAPSLKQKGDWQLLSGFQPEPHNPNEIRWYIKNEQTTQLTKGGSKWATDLDNFIKKNGYQALGK